jgi:hypothetical protein
MDGGMLIEFSSENCSFPIELVRWDKDQFKTSKAYLPYKEQLEKQMKMLQEHMDEIKSVYEALT